MGRLLERESVLAELTRLARQVARGGGGSIVLLRGEAGVGKTAVIRRFTACPGAPMRVLWGWCDPLAAPRPLGPLLDMLARLPGKAVAGLNVAIEDGDTEAIYAGVLHLFADSGGWVCVVEDVHWADGATLDLLRFLARRVETLPLLLVVSYRDDELGEQHSLAIALGDIATCAGLTRIELTPLSLAAVALLAAGSGVNAEALHRLTGGNPFFVTEVLAAGADALRADALPRSVSEAVWGRLARLSPAARDTAYAAAVCGPRAAPALLQATCPGAALGECLDAGVLVADGDAVGFRHELARRATLEQIPDYQRRVLHKRALIALTEPPVNPDALATLSFHADQAGDGDAVLRYGPLAAERAAALGANREAADLYALALRHADGTPAEQKVVWLERHAFASYLSGLAEAAVRSWREAIHLRHELGDRFTESDDLCLLSHILWVLGRISEATEAGEASLRLLQGCGTCPQLARSLINMAALTVHTDASACLYYATRAIALGGELADPTVVIRARVYKGIATAYSSDNGLDAFEALWREIMATHGLAELGGLAGAGVCWVAVLHHDLDRAERCIADLSAFCAERDLALYGQLATSASALVGLYRGDWAHALSCAEDVLTRPGLPPLHRILALISVALVRARRGEQPVTALLDEALGCSEGGEFRLQVWAARAEAAWLAGDDDTARADAQAGLVASADTVQDPWLAGPLRRWAHLTGGPLDGAQAAVDTVTPYGLEIRGDWQGATAEWARRGCPYDVALAQLGGDVQAVQAALATFRGLGARAAARRARQRLAQLRGRSPDTRRSVTSADPHGLTRRQREILDLLAAGHSDTEIAAALYLSPRTVNNHVGAILTKLGVHSRRQAAAYTERQANP